MEVTMVSAVKDYFRRYATFSGRSSRAQFWWVVLAQLILGVVMTIPAVFISIAGAAVPFVGMGLMMVLNIVNAVIFLGLLVPNIALLVRRLHDTGRGGGIVLFFIIAPFVAGIVTALGAISLMPGSDLPDMTVLMVLGIIVYPLLFIWFIVLMCKAGDEYENEYGPVPVITGNNMAQMQYTPAYNPYRNNPYSGNPYQGNNPYQGAPYNSGNEGGDTVPIRHDKYPRS